MKFTVDLKFKIGDKVWLMHNNKPYEDTISQITIQQSLVPNDGILGWHPIIHIEYFLNMCGTQFENVLFATKKELLNSFI